MGLAISDGSHSVAADMFVHQFPADCSKGSQPELSTRPTKVRKQISPTEDAMTDTALQSFVSGTTGTPGTGSGWRKNKFHRPTAGSPSA